MNLHEEIVAYTKFIRLPEIRKIYQSKAEEALAANFSYEEYLHHGLENQHYRRLENRKHSHIRSANFHQKKYL